MSNPNDTPQGRDESEYAEVDRHRALGGRTFPDQAEQVRDEELPDFGKGLREYWKFDPDCTYPPVPDECIISDATALQTSTSITVSPYRVLFLLLSLSLHLTRLLWLPANSRHQRHAYHLRRMREMPGPVHATLVSSAHERCAGPACAASECRC